MSSAAAVVRVYVCSPFRDMQAERAHLHQVVFPLVSQRYQEHGVRLEVIDPRWDEASEEGAEGIVTLAQSLEAIDACRPFFLGIIGHRAGKVLEFVPEDIAERYPHLRHLARGSRTFLETVHGVLRDPEHAAHSYFYFRDPSFLPQIPKRFRSTYFPESPTALHRLENFKEAIRATGRPVKEYTCQWNEANPRVTGLEAFGQAVAADLIGAIGGQFVPEVTAVAVLPGRQAVERKSYRTPAPRPEPTPLLPVPADPTGETVSFESESTKITPKPTVPQASPPRSPRRSTAQHAPEKKSAVERPPAVSRPPQKAQETDLLTEHTVADDEPLVDPDEIDLAALFGDDEPTSAEPAPAVSDPEAVPQPAQRKKR
jgi:hypothetical protein